MDIVSNCLKIQSVAAAVVENFDFWLATLPKKAQKEISVSMVSTQLGIDLATAKQLLEFHTHSPLFFYSLSESLGVFFIHFFCNSFKSLSEKTFLLGSPFFSLSSAS